MPSRFAPFASGRAVRATLVALSVLAIAALPARAADVAWINPSGGAWSTGSNWSGGQVPGSADNAILPELGGGYTVSLDVTPASAGIEVAGADVTLDVNGQSITNSSVTNSGHIANLRGRVFGHLLTNLEGGVIELAPGDSLLASGHFTNHGLIVAGGSGIHLVARAQFEGTGTLELNGAGVLTDADPPQRTVDLENWAGHTIRGSGLIRLPVRNLGLIHANGGFLEIQSIFTNDSATVRVTDGAHMNINSPLMRNRGGRVIGTHGTFTVMCVSAAVNPNDPAHFPQGVGGTIDGNADGQLIAEDGDLRLSAGTLFGGTIARQGSDPDAAVHIGIATPQNLQVLADATLTIDGQLDVTVNGSSLFNDGTVRVPGKLRILGSGGNSISAEGTGQIVLDGGLIETPAGSTFVNGAGQTITGCGTIDANLVNNGTIELDCDGLEAAKVAGKVLINRKDFSVRRGTLYLVGAQSQIVNMKGARFTVASRMIVGQGATLRNNGVVTASGGTVLLGWRGASTVAGGTLAASNHGVYRNVGVTTLQDVTLATGADFTTENRGTTRATGVRVTNYGVNRLAAGSTFSADPGTRYVQAFGGATRLAGGTLTIPLGLELAGTLRGYGTVNGNVTNAGDVTADAAATGLTIQGDYQQLAGAQLTVLSDPGAFGRLAVAGSAALDGSLLVVTPDGYASGSTVEVMTFGARTGQFAECLARTRGPELVARQRFSRTGVAIQVESGAVGVDRTPHVLRFSTRGADFALELPEAAGVSLAVYDVAGRQVAALGGGVREAGVHAFTLRGLELSSGVYFGRVRLQMAGRVETRTARMVFVR